MIRVSDLVHGYREYPSGGGEPVIKTVLNGVSLEIPDGQFAAILGPNGSGKSTLVRHLNGLLRADEGTVLIDGLDAGAEEALKRIRDCVGMVFQNPDNQIIGATVEEDCAFGPEVRGLPSAEIGRRVDESLKTVGLSEQRGVSPDRLSGGGKQRLAIAGAAACLPRCLVLDEPTAMLDPAARGEVLSLLHRLNRDLGITVVLVTHHMEEAAQADRVIIMERGRIVLDGTPPQLFADRAALRVLHLDVPPITAVADALREQGFAFSSPVLSQRQFVEEFLHLAQAAGGAL